MLQLPDPRGDVSQALLAALVQDPHAVAAIDAPMPAEPLSDEDLQLALYLCYELHYRGLPGVSDGWEWEPSLLALRRQLEARFEAGLLVALGPPEGDVAPAEMDVALRAVEAADEAPSLSRHLEREGTRAEMLEFIVHRSAYQLKEADPHSWALPRLTGAPKAAMVEIQADEYGGGDPERMHSALFAKSMDGLGLDSRYGAYLDRIPGVTLATVNLMSLLGLHRRWRGALVGHLALFEMSSSLPNRRYGNGLRRLGCDRETTDFIDEHVTADAVHEAIAAVDLAGGLARQDPALSADVIWGARALGRNHGQGQGRSLDVARRLRRRAGRGPRGAARQGRRTAARVGVRRAELARDPRTGRWRAQRRLRRHRGGGERDRCRRDGPAHVQRRQRPLGPGPAGEKDVLIAGGGTVVQQAIAAGLVDELQVHVAPMFLGGGAPLFDGMAADVGLEITRVIDSPTVTHVLYRVT